MWNKEIANNYKMDEILKVGLPELPDINQVNKAFSKIWIKKSLTNFGEYERLFEAKLKSYLGVSEVVLFCNGTSALEALIHVLQIRGSIVTPAYSFIATLTAILRNNLDPSFVDVRQTDGNLDETQVTHQVLKDAGAILGVHAYGFPCRVQEIETLAKKSSLPVIYDAAHTMGSIYNGRPLCNFGLASILSFHATKILSSVEGGAVVTDDPNLASDLRKFRYFGFNSEKSYSSGLGTNAKMSEFHAIIGLAQLENFEEKLAKRRELFYGYQHSFSRLDGFDTLKPMVGNTPNGSYVPIIVKQGYEFRKKLLMYLKKNNVYAKPYFDIDLSKIGNQGKCNKEFPETKKLTNSVICLPIHSSITLSQVQGICELIGRFEG